MSDKLTPSIEVLRWVNEQGGIEAVKKRLMPEGMEWLVDAWPRFEDGKPVRFLDDFERYGNESCVSVVTMYADGSFALNFRAYSKGERVKRPASSVLAADGEPLREGETVYVIVDRPNNANVIAGDAVTVVSADDEYDVDVKDGKGELWFVDSDHLTYQRPDSWERIEKDAGCTATKYNERRGTIFTTKQQVARDLVRRCRALAERERGE